MSSEEEPFERIKLRTRERSGGMKAVKDAPKIRELFIEELAEVKGGSEGNPVKTLLEKLGCCDSTMACCEEGQCCVDPI